MSQVKVVFFDVDGTLSAHNPGDDSSILDRVPESTRTAINKLKENGVLPVLATGRNFGMVQELVDHLSINDVIANNGRYVRVHDQVVFQQPFEHQQVMTIAQSLLKSQVGFVYETADKLYRPVSSNFLPDSSMSVEVIADDIYPQDVLQFLIRQTEPVQFKLETPRIKVLQVAPTVFDITLSASNKAIGVKHFLKAINLSSEQAMAFGDEENDLEMFQAVGISVAMGDSTQQVKQNATYVTGRLDQAGIYRALSHYRLI